MIWALVSFPVGMVLGFGLGLMLTSEYADAVIEESRREVYRGSCGCSEVVE